MNAMEPKAGAPRSDPRRKPKDRRRTHREATLLAGRDQIASSTEAIDCPRSIAPGSTWFMIGALIVFPLHHAATNGCELVLTLSSLPLPLA